jgi:hypothetical protein
VARSPVALLGVCLAALMVVAYPASSIGDPASDLIEAESQKSTASVQVTAAEATVRQAEEALAPIAERAEGADHALVAAEGRLALVEEELVDERQAAARQVGTAEANYEDEKSSHDTASAIGIVLAIAAALIGGVAFAFGRFRKWPLSKALTQVLAGVLGLALVGGLALAFVPSSPRAPEFSTGTLKLAGAAEGDPADPATPELLRADAAVKPLAARAEPLDHDRGRSEEQLEQAESTANDAESRLAASSRQVNAAEREVEKLEAIAEEESNFREEATTIDYNQLIKNPEAYRGEKVVYTGQILQIQESGNFGGFMLLSVTDEGYGFWTDNIWVEFEEKIGAAEEDIITVYGKITGSEEYETQIGGSTYVPKMQAKYIDE